MAILSYLQRKNLLRRNDSLLDTRRDENDQGFKEISLSRKGFEMGAIGTFRKYQKIDKMEKRIQRKIDKKSEKITLLDRKKIKNIIKRKKDLVICFKYNLHKAYHQNAINFPEKYENYGPIQTMAIVMIKNSLMSQEKIDSHISQKYKILKKLGSGAYGHVWKVSKSDKPTQFLALKKIFQAFQHCTDAQRTFRQISILKKIEHQNIIKLHQVLPSLSTRDIYLVFQYMNTDLYHAVYEGTLEQIHKKYIIYQLLLGIHYLHTAGLIHRDLKPSNLLLNQQCNLKICDFGLVRFLGCQGKDDSVMTEGVATKWYRAPEIIFGSQKYNEKIDMWSIGCILAQMTLKNPLFNCPNTISHLQKIIQIIGRPSIDEIKEIGTESIESIIKQCQSIKQKSPKDLFGSNTDEQCVDLILSLLKFGSKKRFSALQALRHPYLKEFYRESDIKSFKGEITLQTDDNVKLTTQAYQQLISKHFFEKKQPTRFSDLRRGQKSFGKVLGQYNSRKNSNEKDIQKQQRKNVHLFEEILREKQSSLKNTRNKSNSNQAKDKQNMIPNTKQSFNPLQKQHIKPQKQPGTFAALRKVTTSKLFK